MLEVISSYQELTGFLPVELTDKCSTAEVMSDNYTSQWLVNFGGRRPLTSFNSQQAELAKVKLNYPSFDCISSISPRSTGFDTCSEVLEPSSFVMYSNSFVVLIRKICFVFTMYLRPRRSMYSFASGIVAIRSSILISPNGTRKCAPDV